MTKSASVFVTACRSCLANGDAVYAVKRSQL